MLLVHLFWAFAAKGHCWRSAKDQSVDEREGGKDGIAVLSKTAVHLKPCYRIVMWYERALYEKKTVALRTMSLAMRLLGCGWRYRIPAACQTCIVEGQRYCFNAVV